MRNYYNKTPIENDLVNDYLGYWTDEGDFNCIWQNFNTKTKAFTIFYLGAYYYYNTEEGKNYEETILDIINNFTGEAIPYR